MKIKNAKIYFYKDGSIKIIGKNKCYLDDSLCFKSIEDAKIFAELLLKELADKNNVYKRF